MNKRFVASMILKTIALILFAISLVDSVSTTSKSVVTVTLTLGWIFYGIDKIFVDNEEED